MPAHQKLEEQKVRVLAVTMLDEFRHMAVQPARGGVDSSPSSLASTRWSPQRTRSCLSTRCRAARMCRRSSQEVQLRLDYAFTPYPKELASDLQVRFFQVCLLCANGFSATSGRTKSLICDKTSVAVAGDFPTSTSPTVGLNAIKNATEIEGFRASQIRWGTALV
jgi:hypothetical protein